jgi:hypothetical protein
MFCSATYYLISGNSKSDVDKSIALAQGMIIEWYMK